MLSLSAASGLQALAQTPDAGALQQGIDRSRTQQLPATQRPSVAPPEELAPGAGLTVTVKSFRFSGNTLVSTEKLALAVESYLNKPLDFQGLQRAAAAAAEVYRQGGWFVRAFLPKQDVRDGVVTIQIAEALFGGLRYEGSASKRVSAGKIEAMIAAAQVPGTPLNTARLDRALLLIDDLSGVSVTGSLVPGGRPAETDLLLKALDENVLTGGVLLDNTGSRSTGAERINANVEFASPLGMGDRGTVHAIHARGLQYYRLGYGLPVGSNGLRVEVNSSQMNYQVITSEFRAANIHGKSSSYGVAANYPVVRGRVANLYLSAAYDSKNFENKASGATTSDYKADSVTVGASGNLFDQWGGGAANMASLHATLGDIDLDGSPNQARDRSTTQTQGGFKKLRYALSRQQFITKEMSLYGLLSGQLASKNLDSSEKFYLGGANGVRAYPANEAGGSEGSMLNFELRWRARADLVVTAFYDWGSIAINKHTGFAGEPARNRYGLQGAGLALAWKSPAGVDISATYARRIGHNPGRDLTTGRDQDGSLTRDRFWLTASLPF